MSTEDDACWDADIEKCLKAKGFDTENMTDAEVTYLACSLIDNTDAQYVLQARNHAQHMLNLLKSTIGFIEKQRDLLGKPSIQKSIGRSVLQLNEDILKALSDNAQLIADKIVPLNALIKHAGLDPEELEATGWYQPSCDDDCKEDDA
jgi:hypothetical protein